MSAKSFLSRPNTSRKPEETRDCLIKGHTIATTRDFLPRFARPPARPPASIMCNFETLCYVAHAYVRSSCVIEALLLHVRRVGGSERATAGRRRRRRHLLRHLTPPSMQRKDLILAPPSSLMEYVYARTRPAGRPAVSTRTSLRSTHCIA